MSGHIMPLKRTAMCKIWWKEKQDIAYCVGSPCDLVSEAPVNSF